MPARCAAAILMLTPALLIGDVVTYEANVLPEEVGWERTPFCEPERWLDNGWIVQRVEVACGGGHFLKNYASHVRGVVGLDLSDVQVKMAKWKLRSRIAAGTAEIVQGDASQLPWEDNSFSVGTTMGSFIGFPEPLKSLKEIYRVLRPGGRAVVSIEFNAEDGKDHSKEIEKYGMWVWTEGEVRAMMKEAGFSEISITYDKGLGMPKMMFAYGVKR